MKNDTQSDETRDIRRKDRAHFLHPWTHFDSFREKGSLAIAEGRGCYIYDTDGKRYLDAVAGLWCCNIGLGRAEMARAIAEQVERLAFANPFTDVTNVPASELASKLARIAPGSLNHVFYSSGGSTAVDSAYRLIQFYQRSRGKPEKQHVISRETAYHGSTYISISIGGKKGDRVPEFEFKTDTIHHVSCPHYYRAPEGLSEDRFCRLLVEELEAKILEIGPDRVAAFFAEPVVGAGGVIVPPAGYHRATWEVCRKYDVLYVSDEVVTGFGRLGHWFSSRDLFGFQPDIITCAKGLTSGYLPLGATLFSDEINEVIGAPDSNRIFAHGFTYSGHAACCAAALKNIEIIEREALLEKVRDNSPYLEERLKTLHDLPSVGDVRGCGFMMCVESVADKATKKPFPDRLKVGKRIAVKCEELGLIVRPIMNMTVLSPPLILTREQIDFCVDTIRQAMIAVADELGTESLD